MKHHGLEPGTQADSTPGGARAKDRHARNPVGAAKDRHARNPVGADKDRHARNPVGADADELLRQIGDHGVSIALFVGSGWQAAAAILGEPEESVSVDRLAGFAMPTVDGHHGRIDLVGIGAVPVLVFHSRVHLYEGHSATQVAHPVRVAAAAGCTTALFTNASGSLTDRLDAGDLVAVSDHINLTGASPTAGPDTENRFIDLAEAYSPRLRACAATSGTIAGEGVYVGVHGPQLETPAEVRMLCAMGADLVGMSTVLEVIAARQGGMEVAAFSLVTNRAGRPAFGMADVLEVGGRSAERGATLLEHVIRSGGPERGG